MTSVPGRRARELRLVPLLALVALLAALAVVAYYPFTWDPPRVVSNTVVRNADGSLTFGTMNRARTPGTPSWLTSAQRSGGVDVRLLVLPRFPQTQSTSAIMLLARDYWHSDFCLAQNGSGLSVWLRRGGSTVNGEPPIDVNDVFRRGRWTEVEMKIREDRLTLKVDGGGRLDRKIAKGSLSLWQGGRLALGGEVNGGGGSWQGVIRTAQVRTANHSVDYVTPGALVIAKSYYNMPDHVMSFPPPSPTEWLVLLLHFVSFVPVGFLIVTTHRAKLSVPTATLVAAAIALCLAAGKFLFARHTAVADIAVEVLGAFLGALVASHLSPRLRFPTLPGARRTPTDA